MSKMEVGIRYRVPPNSPHLKGEKIQRLKPEEYLQIEEEKRVFF